MAAVEHIAGVVVGGVQKCERCEVVLVDYRGAVTSDDADSLAGWEPGMHVCVDGGASWIGSATPCVLH